MDALLRHVACSTACDLAVNSLFGFVKGDSVLSKLDGRWGGQVACCNLNVGMHILIVGSANLENKVGSLKK